MKYRHWLLLFFCLSLLLSLEKALILKALLPVIAIGFQSQFSRKRALTLMLILVGIVGVLFFFGKMGRIDYEGQAKQSMAKLEKQLIDLPGIRKKNFEDVDNSIKANENSIGVFEKQLSNLSSIKKDNVVAFQEQREKNAKYYINYEEQIRASLRQANLSTLFLKEQRVKNAKYFINYASEVTVALNSEKVAYETHHKYNVFGAGQMGFALNRLFWIPYVTAYDWLKYFDEHLHNQFLGGSSSFLVSKILGVQQFPIEREVFKYQFGAGGPQTGSANALFLVDAFVNFGWLGIIGYAYLLAAIIFLIQVGNNPAMISCLYFFLVQAVGGGLLGILVGNGLLLLIFISFFIRPNFVRRVSGTDGV